MEIIKLPTTEDSREYTLQYGGLEASFWKWRLIKDALDLLRRTLTSFCGLCIETEGYNCPLDSQSSKDEPCRTPCMHGDTPYSKTLDSIYQASEFAARAIDELNTLCWGHFFRKEEGINKIREHL